MASFPSRAANGDRIRPTSRSFSIGEYPVKHYKSLSGSIVKRSFGNKPTNYTLKLEFKAVNEQILLAIFKHYQTQQGITLPFAIPDSLFEGYTREFYDYMQEPADGSGRWYYAAAPEVNSLYNGLSDISIELVSEITASINIG